MVNRFYRSTFYHARSGKRYTLDHGGDNIALAILHGHHVARAEGYQWVGTKRIRADEQRKLGEFVVPEDPL